jgi:hypothetical protein
MTNAYATREWSLFCFLPYLSSIAFIGVGIMAAWAAEARLAGFLLAGGVVFALVGLSFQYLVIRAKGDGISICFGPLPLVRTQVSFADIRKVERGRLAFVGGVDPKRFSWRLRRADRAIWSVGGREFVMIHRQHDAIRVVTRDADNLARFLECRIVAA